MSLKCSGSCEGEGGREGRREGELDEFEDRKQGKYISIICIIYPSLPPSLPPYRSLSALAWAMSPMSITTSGASTLRAYRTGRRAKCSWI